MMRMVLLLTLIVSGLPVWAGVLFLKNGKRISYRDQYEVKDGYVCFHDASGNYLKLPESLIDFEATEAHAESETEKGPAREKDRTSPDARAEKKEQQGWLPDKFYENESQTTEITKESVAKHRTPRSSAAWTPRQPRRNIDYELSKQESINYFYRVAYQAGTERIKGLKARLDQAEVRLNRLYDRNVDPDDDPPPQGAIEKAESEVEQLKAQIDREKKRLAQLVREGRQAGAKNITVPVKKVSNR